MATSCRTWWWNCALEPDSEILEIDSLEDRISPLDPNVSKIRDLISSFELCHHKSERWVENIIEAIGAGETRKGLGTRTPGQQHPREKIWQNVCEALSMWCEGNPSKNIDLLIDNVPSLRIIVHLGELTPIKIWQVQRVIEKIRSVIHWPQSNGDPSTTYVWILFSGGEYESTYRNTCPEFYKEQEDFWLKTVQTVIHDTNNGNPAELSLGLAIDMLWPCHWRFVKNLQIVLEAINGKLHSEEPFAACGRNINLFPKRERMETISKTLKTFYGDLLTGNKIDKKLLTFLRKPTEEKCWLAASLDKTIKLQLDPPAELSALSALEGPDWIKS